MGLRTIIRTSIIKITGDPFTTTSRVPPNVSMWEQTKYPPKPGRTQRNYIDDGKPTLTAHPFVQSDGPINRPFVPARSQRVLPSDFVPVAKAFIEQPLIRPVPISARTIRAMAQDFVPQKAPALWDYQALPPKVAKIVRSLRDETFIRPPAVVTLNPSLWDYRLLPPKPGRTQRNYDDFVFIPVIAPAPETECIPFRDSIVPTDSPRLSVMASATVRNVIMPAGFARSALLSAFALRATATPASILRPEVVPADCTPLVVAPAPAPGEDCEMCFKGVRTLTVDTQLTSADVGWVFLCVGTHTHTLPTSVASATFFFKNIDSGVITIAGTIDGDPAGYQLVNPYQFVQVTGDGSAYVITGDN